MWPFKPTINPLKPNSDIPETALSIALKHFSCLEDPTRAYWCEKAQEAVAFDPNPVTVVEIQERATMLAACSNGVIRMSECRIGAKHE